MANRRLRTADYSQEARERLGDAVTNQREADGYKWRPAFAEAADISLRSLVAIESGEPGVGGKNLRAVGRALSTWTADTPRTILDNGPIPPLVAEQQPTVDEWAPRDDMERKIMNSSLSRKEKRDLVRGYRDALEEERMLFPEHERHPDGATAQQSDDEPLKRPGRRR